MNTLYKAITIAILLTVSLASRAQNAIVHFGYDGDGNRISRTLTIDRDEEKSQAADSTKSLSGIIETLNDDGNATLSIYPNPVKDRVTIETESVRHISISNMIGQLVFEGAAEGDSFEYDFSSQEVGVYLIRIETSNGTISKRIIVTK